MRATVPPGRWPGSGVSSRWCSRSTLGSARGRLGAGNCAVIVAAYEPALTDVIIMAPSAKVFITGPDIIRTVTGEEIDAESLGGPGTHGRRGGVAHVVAESEQDAYDTAAALVDLLGAQGHCRAEPPERSFENLLPRRRKRAYDVRPVVSRLLDGEQVELHAGWARNVVTTLGRLGGGTVGVVASNPLRKGGCLDALSAEKAARFVRMCDGFGVPLVVLVAGGVEAAVTLGVVDEVIDPDDTRQAVARVLAGHARTRGRHGNIPR